MTRLSRRGFVRAAAAAAGFASMPAWAQGHATHAMKGGAPIRVGFDQVSGAVIDLAVGHGPRMVQGR